MSSLGFEPGLVSTHTFEETVDPDRQDTNLEISMPKFKGQCASGLPSEQGERIEIHVAAKTH